MDGHKALTGVSIKDADQGIVEALFSTLNVVDHDGDVTMPGAFEDGAQVRISAYGHASWGTALPVGKGVIRTTDDAAVLEGKFFLNTQHGADTFQTIKELGDLQEWSYGFDVVESSDGEHDDQKVRFLEKLKVHEVSPVMLGAGIDTRTLAVKYGTAGATMAAMAAGLHVSGNKFQMSGNKRPFVDEVEHALGSVQALVARAQGLGSLRAEQDGKSGRVLSAANRERLAALMAAMRDAGGALGELLDETDPDKGRANVIREYVQFARLRANL